MHLKEGNAVLLAAVFAAGRGKCWPADKGTTGGNDSSQPNHPQDDDGQPRLARYLQERAKWSNHPHVFIGAGRAAVRGAMRFPALRWTWGRPHCQSQRVGIVPVP